MFKSTKIANLIFGKCTFDSKDGLSVRESISYPDKTEIEWDGAWGLVYHLNKQIEELEKRISSLEETTEPARLVDIENVRVFGGIHVGLPEDFDVTNIDARGKFGAGFGAMIDEINEMECGGSGLCEECPPLPKKKRKTTKKKK